MICVENGFTETRRQTFCSCNVMRCNVKLSDVIRCCAMLYDVIQCYTMLYNVTRCYTNQTNEASARKWILRRKVYWDSNWGIIEKFHGFAKNSFDTAAKIHFWKVILNSVENIHKRDTQSGILWRTFRNVTLKVNFLNVTMMRKKHFAPHKIRI